MTHLKTTLLIVTTSFLSAQNAKALQPVQDKVTEPAKPIVKISPNAVQAAQSIFDAPLALDASELNVEPAENTITGEETVYSDALDINVEVTDMPLLALRISAKSIFSHT